jgi:hypothetical protein
MPAPTRIIDNVTRAFERQESAIIAAHTRLRKDGTARPLSTDAECRIEQCRLYLRIALQALTES